MPTICKHNMIEQGFNYADEEMNDIFESRIEKLEPKNIIKNLPLLPRRARKRITSRRRKEKTPIAVL